MRRGLLIAGLVLALSGAAMAEPAGAPDQPLADAAQEARAQTLFGEVRCVVCQHEAFYRRQAQLPGTVFNVAWMAPVCDCVICSQCGYIHWFYPMKA